MRVQEAAEEAMRDSVLGLSDDECGSTKSGMKQTGHVAGSCQKQAGARRHSARIRKAHTCYV
jgi:hypothetical protein